MKKLDSFHIFLANYFFWAGALIALIAAVLPASAAIQAIGSFMIIASCLVNIVNAIWELQFRIFGTACTPDNAAVRVPAPSAVHVRGVFFFTLECTVGGRTIQSPLMALPKWSKHVRNGTLVSMPQVTVYTKGDKTLINGYFVK